MPKQVDAAAQRREIRAAARRVFARRGVGGTGLAHVAAAAGMGRSSLYHYFPDKEALLRELLQDALEGEARLFHEGLASDAPPLERVARLARAGAAALGYWAREARVLFDLRLRDARRFRSFFREVRGDLAAAIAEGQSRGEIDCALDAARAASLVIAVLDGLLFQHLADPRAFGDLEELADELERAVRKVLRP